VFNHVPGANLVSVLPILDAGKILARNKRFCEHNQCGCLSPFAVATVWGIGQFSRRKPAGPFF
jgi:hypothetical protein